MKRIKRSRELVRKTTAVGHKALRQTSKRVGSHFDQYVVGRFSKMKHVRRPVIAWLLLILMLTLAVFIQTRQLRDFYIAEVPVRGGVLREGMVGEVTNINPIYASSSADASLAELIFSSLVELNGQGKIVGDIATKWSVNSAGTVYKFNLRDDVRWHDGRLLTAEDVEFTFNMLEHPDANSPLLGSWRGVRVTAEGDHSVSFRLPNPFAPFLEGLSSVGILPKHILEDVRPEQLRGHRFNLTSPIGSGPFRFIDSVSLPGDDGVIRFRLNAHDAYHGGEPRLDSLNLYIYRDRERMLNDYNEGSLALVSGLSAADIPASGQIVEAVADELSTSRALEELTGGQITLEQSTSNVHSVKRTSIVMLFLNNREGLFSNIDIRRAVALAINRKELLGLSDSYYHSARSPLLEGQLGYSSRRLLPGVNITKAAQALNREGWKLNDDGYRYKNKKRLKLTIVSQAEDIFPEVLAALQTQLKRVGIELTAKLVSADTIQQDYLAEHNYQAVLYGINIGFDPDQFAFWHSSQAGTNGRNLSGYRSTEADTALEAGRTRTEADLRRAKYQAFVTAWVRDIPAIALYQPTFIYANKKQVRGLDVSVISQASDRYHNVEKWTVNTGSAQKLY